MSKIKYELVQINEHYGVQKTTIFLGGLFATIKYIDFKDRAFCWAIDNRHFKDCLTDIETAK